MYQYKSSDKIKKRQTVHQECMSDEWFRDLIHSSAFLLLFSLYPLILAELSSRFTIISAHDRA